jgi:membrane protease YdiL (CAAX protease family)
MNILSELRTRMPAYMAMPSRIGAWKLSFFEALALVWALLSSAMFSQALAIILIKWANLGSKGGQLLVSGVALHLSIIALGIVIYFLNAFKVLNGIQVKANSIQLKWGIFYVVTTLFFTSAFEWLWKSFLEGLHSFGIIGPLPPFQMIVEVVQSTHNQWVLGGLFLMVSVFAPISEEWLFRAGLYRYLKSKLTPHVAMIVSALIFGGIHWNVLSFVPLVFLGLIFSDAYERTGRLRAPIILHALFNSISFINVLFFNVQ